MDISEARELTRATRAPKKPKYQRRLDRKIKRLAKRGYTGFIMNLDIEVSIVYRDYLQEQGFRANAERYLTVSWAEKGETPNYKCYMFMF